MPKLKQLISLYVMLFSCSYTIAQNDFVDSVYEVNEYTEYNNEYIAMTSDTGLHYSTKHISVDSLNAYKNSKSFAYVREMDSLLRSLQAKEKKAAVNSKPREKNWLELFFLSKITKYVFWSLAGVFVLVILYKLFFTKGFFQRRTARSPVAIMADEEDLSMTADYDKLIGQAIAEKNYKNAVRYLYLKSLQLLVEKGVVVFSADKTNYQYVRELAGKPYKSSFANLTLNYEYVCYGEFDIDEVIFSKLEAAFKQFYNQL
ncbi:hypothetical protein ACQ33O_10715 [Ferruginibacter sp. SUN002]|uniref:hypothetical protein n=1 Tax=Ferruginibacter sp. SUN002 TaxID=2937789 RepID=UPI003D363FAB